MTDASALLNRRDLLRLGTGAAGMTFLQPVSLAGEARWMREPGRPLSPRGDVHPSRAEVGRVNIMADPLAPGAGSSSTPLEHLHGTITPNDLHFERHHSGIPAIEPSGHRLFVGGLTDRSLSFDLEALSAYPHVTRNLFLECSGNSWRNTRAEPADETAGQINGLVSGVEWTGVPLRHLLAEAGANEKASWILAEGADAAGHLRSVPLAKAMDDTMVALYQNGEPLRPAQGFPMRLIVPGYEGNVSVKWLHRVLLTDEPAQAKAETSKYTDLLKDGTAEQFTFPMGVKSVITSPSGRMRLARKGVYEITGLAWSGAGRITRVDVSADGGESWEAAEFQNTAEPLHLVRFRIGWRWRGRQTTLQSRAVDEKGNVQPARTAALARYSVGNIYHYNGIQSWRVDETGLVRNAYA